MLLKTPSYPEPPFRIPEHKALAFLHIGKTAGLTFSGILQAKYTPEMINPIPTPFPSSELIQYRFYESIIQANELLYPYNENNIPYQLVIGHYDFRIIERYSHLIPMTFLRHPLVRHISNFHYLQRHGHSDPWIRTIWEHLQGITLYEWATNPRFFNHKIGNWQTHTLAGVFWQDNPPQLSDDELLKRAMQNLARCAFIGLTERFDDSLLLCCYTFGWQPVDSYQRINSAPRPTILDDIAPEAYEALVAHSSLDIQLYEFARMLYNHRLSYMLEHTLLGMPPPRSFYEIPDFSLPFQSGGIYAKRIFERALRQHIHAFISQNALSKIN